MDLSGGLNHFLEWKIPTWRRFPCWLISFNWVETNHQLVNDSPFKKNGGVDPLNDVQVFFQQLVTSIYPPVSRRIFWGINGKYTIRKKKN